MHSVLRANSNIADVLIQCVCDMHVYVLRECMCMHLDRRFIMCKRIICSALSLIERVENMYYLPLIEHVLC